LLVGLKKDLPFRLITLSRVGGKSSFTLDIKNINIGVIYG